MTDEICHSHTCMVSLWILSCMDHIVEFSGSNISGLLGFFAQCVLRFALQDSKKHSHHNNTHYVAVLELLSSYHVTFIRRWIVLSHYSKGLKIICLLPAKNN